MGNQMVMGNTSAQMEVCLRVSTGVENGMVKENTSIMTESSGQASLGKVNFGTSQDTIKTETSNGRS